MTFPSLSIPRTKARCRRCLWPLWLCVCADIPIVQSRTRVVLVRHVSESMRMSNTGRIAALSLRNCEVIEHGRQGVATDCEALSRPGTWLLYPEGEERAAAPDPPPRQLVVLDATWTQARRMRQRIPGLRGLPILRLPPTIAPAARLREVPAPGFLSTLEAIAHALRLLEGQAGTETDGAGELLRLFVALVERARLTGRQLPPLLPRDGQ